MKPQYQPKTLAQALGCLVEEAGEVLAAVGKTQRWGMESRNPEAPVKCAACLMICDRPDMLGTHVGEGIETHVFVDARETNREWILRELYDLEHAIMLSRSFLLADQETEKKG